MHTLELPYQFLFMQVLIIHSTGAFDVLVLLVMYVVSVAGAVPCDKSHATEEETQEAQKRGS